MAARPMTDYSRAACVGADPEWFTPDADDRATIRKAANICARCTLIADCRADARAEQLTGVYGGLYHHAGIPNPPPRLRPSRAGLEPVGVRQCLTCPSRDLAGQSRYCPPCFAAVRRQAWREYKERKRNRR